MALRFNNKVPKNAFNFLTQKFNLLRNEQQQSKFNWGLARSCEPFTKIFFITFFLCRPTTLKQLKHIKEEKLRGMLVLCVKYSSTDC